MREIEVLRVAKRDIIGNRNREHESYGTYEFVGANKGKDFECQYNSKRDNVQCTCKRKRRESGYFNSSRQVYRSQRYIPRDFREVGVGSVKTVYKKRIKIIHLPETEDRGVGSSDLLSVSPRKTRNFEGGYYDQKRTSSKCVGGVVENTYIPSVSKKLSPIIQTKSCYTSPKLSSFVKSEIMGYSSKENIQRFNKEKVENTELVKFTINTIQTDKEALVARHDKNRTPLNDTFDDKKISSVSLVQRVHNLENPSDEKIKTSIEFIENKMEKEFKKIFTNTNKSHSNTKIKPIPDCKSPSVLRRRFEALRRGLSKKEGDNKGSITSKTSSKKGLPIRKDVSIASDPPSLEARSYSNTKIHSPMTSVTNAYNTPTSKISYDKSFTGEEITENWQTGGIDSECQDVKGMFKLWGKKFNLEEANCSKTSPKPSITSKKQKKKVKLELPTKEMGKEKKKEGKRFLFFGKKGKTKSKQPFRPKQGVTAGRCELGDGLTIKIGATNDYTSKVPVNKINNSQIYPDSAAGKDWIKKFLCNEIDSRNSVRIRWNNNMYTTSSSTVFELMDCVYKNTGILFSSKSEVSSKASSYYNSYMKPQVNFMQQNIQAWMIPKMMIDSKKENVNLSTNMSNQNKRKKKNIEITFSNQKWFIDKSTAFSQKIELVLHSKNFIETNNPKSSEYIVIDIPKGYFSDTSSDDKGTNHTSDEQVYNVVEYEQINSSSYLKMKKMEHKLDTKDLVSKNRVSIGTGIIDNESKILSNKTETEEVKRNSEQDSLSYIPKGCDVISVGIITQRDIRDIKKPILKINDDIEDESEHVLPPPKKCEFAESFLQDYYRNWTSLGIDLLSWCVSDYKLRGPSDNNSFKSFNNQGDGSKSCPNIHDGYPTSTIVSSCETSSCSHCTAIEEKKSDDQKSLKFFNKFRRKNIETTQFYTEGKRVLPKDSLEVFKRRKLYAASNKSKWGTNNDDRSEPFFMPSNFNDCPKVSSGIQKKKKCKKRVMLPVCDIIDEISDKIVEGIMNYKGASGCDNCNSKSQQYPKQANVIPRPICEIPPAPCKEICVTKRKPACSKKNSPSCNVPTPPSCPAGPPTPCQKPCPPSPPPCQMFQPCLRPPTIQSNVSKSCSQSSIQRTHKPTPQKLHSPIVSSPRPCKEICVTKRKPACSIKNSPSCNVPTPPSCPAGPPTPCQKPCPPSPPPCQIFQPCFRPPTNHSNVSKSCSQSSIQRTHKPIPQKLHSPRSSGSCVCLKKPPVCDLPRYPVKEKSSCSSTTTHSAVSSSHHSPPQALQSSECPNQSTALKSCSQSSNMCANRPILPRTSSPEKKSPTKSRPCVCLKKQSLCDIPQKPVQKPVNEKSSCISTPSQLAESSSNKSLPRCKNSRYPCQSCKSVSSEKCRKSSSHDFPWPFKNQLSNAPSKELGLNLKKSPQPQPCLPQKNSSKRFTALKRLIQKISSSSIKEKECKPNCANRFKVDKCESPRAPPPTAVCPPPPTNACKNPPKISGLFLKKLPMPRECPASVDDTGVIRLNSREKLSIKLKQSTPSTEEIREGCDIKVLDDDGQTLYERRDYRKVDKNRMHFVQDLYRDSQVQRVSTPNPDMVLDKKSKEINEYKSNTSLSNIIEINLSLKFKNGDKTAEFNFDKADEKLQNEMDNSEVNIESKSCKQIYVLQEKPKQTNDDLRKKDVNINIIIKNYKTPVKLPINKHSVSLSADEFSKNIVKKFQSVSTGYSDIIEHQAYSVHRATIDLTNSSENTKSLSRLSVEISNKELRESTNGSRCDCSNKEKSVSDIKENDVQELLTSNTVSQIKLDTSIEKTQTTNDDKSATSISFANTDENLFSDDTNLGDKSITNYKKFSREEKKELLKKIFETASEIKKTDNTKKLQGIRHLLRAVLTSDSSHEDFEVNNELTKQLTYDSLNPKYINSAVIGDSSISTKFSSKNESEIYPTRENVSECDISVKENAGCLCKHFAKKLNINKDNVNACCCRGNDKLEKEVICNLINENIFSIDIETQYTDSLTTQVVKNANNLDTSNSKRKPHEKVVKIKKLNEPTIKFLDDKIDLNAKNKSYNMNKYLTADVLQLNEMKKAVLEIYAERTISGQGTHMIARLPKFICDKESEILNYETIAYSRFSKQNIVLSIAR